MVINRSRYEEYWRCPRAYYWRYCRNVVRAQTAEALRVGAAVHKFLEFWHRHFDLEQALLEMQGDFARTLHQFAEIPLAQEAEQQLRAQAELLCRAYATQYGTNDEGFKVIDTELQDDAPLGNGHHLRFRIDALVAWDNKLWVGENKTTRYMGEAFLKSFYFNHQIIAYVYGAASVLKQPVAGCMLNILRKPQRNVSVAFHREPVIVTKQHMRDMLDSFTNTADDITRRDPNNKADWPQSTKSCGSCDFLNICAYDAEPVGPMFVNRSEDYVDINEVEVATAVE